MSRKKGDASKYGEPPLVGPYNAAGLKEVMRQTGSIDSEKELPSWWWAVIIVCGFLIGFVSARLTT